ncbi:MAG: hypothetical protein N2450_09110 [bacterium]|nr:hypothetical protein [bacterium]
MAQTNVQRMIKECDSLYKFGEFELAIQKAKEAISLPSLTTQQKVEFERILAFSYAATERHQESERHFTNILTLNPSFTLDSIRTSPKIFQRFRAAQFQFQTTIKKNEPKQATLVDSSLLKKIDLQNKQLRKQQKLWKSAQIGLFCPGMGMLNNNEKTKGWFFLITETVGLSTAIYATLKVEDAKKVYQQEQNTSNIEKRYNHYRNWVHIRNGAWIATGVIHWIGVSDVLLRKNSIQMALITSQKSVHLSFYFPVKSVHNLH